MLPGAMGLLGKLGPVLKLVGLDPARMANRLGRQQIEPRFDAAVGPVAERLEREGMTPAAKSISPEAERQMIRSAMYLLAKAALPFKTGANVAADFLRDQHDDQVVAQVGPLITPTTTTREAVEIIKRHFVERIL